MNGRCDNEAIDPADDVCDLCGGEFCEACLVAWTKRTRKVVCKECSLIQARVRPGSITRVRSKREAKRRREEIKAERSSLQAEGRFSFFDDDDPISDPETESAQEPKKKRFAARFSKDSPEGDDENTLALLVNDSSDSTVADDWITQFEDEDVLDEAGSHHPLTLPEAPAMEQLIKLRSEQPPAETPPAVALPEPDFSAPADFATIDPFTGQEVGAESIVFDLSPEPAMFDPNPEPTPEPEPAPEPAMFDPNPEPAPEPAMFDPNPESATVPPTLASPAPVPSALRGSDTNDDALPKRRSDDPDANPSQDDADQLVPPALRG